jgi:hypothetical protein
LASKKIIKLKLISCESVSGDVISSPTFYLSFSLGQRSRELIKSSFRLRRWLLTFSDFKTSVGIFARPFVIHHSFVRMFEILLSLISPFFLLKSLQIVSSVLTSRLNVCLLNTLFFNFWNYISTQSRIS